MHSIQHGIQKTKNEHNRTLTNKPNKCSEMQALQRKTKYPLKTWHQMLHTTEKKLTGKNVQNSAL